MRMPSGLSVSVLSLLLLALSAPFAPAASADPATTVVLTIGQQSAAVNGESVSLDTAPVIEPESGRTFVPVRFIGETLGAYVGWDGNAQKVTYLTGNTRIELFIGQTTANVNGSSVTLGAAPYIDANNRTVVPVRFVSEQMGASVGWDGDAQAVTITAPWAGKVVLLKDTMFSPLNLTVAVGTRITWVNLDPMVHNIAAPDFHSETLSRGQAYSHTFNKAGTFRYVCAFHPGMEATITVQ